MSQIRKRAQRLDSQSRLIEFGLHWKQRAAFHPPMPDSGIFGKALLVIGRAQKLVGFPQTVPFFFGKCGVAAFYDVIIHCDDVKRGCIGGGVRIGIAFEPVHEVRALRNFMRDLAVSRWYLLTNSRAVRVLEKSPAALSAKEVQNESRPKNQANPGRWLSPEVRYPATSPVPR